MRPRLAYTIYTHAQSLERALGFLRGLLDGEGGKHFQRHGMKDCFEGHAVIGVLCFTHLHRRAQIAGLEDDTHEQRDKL